MQERQAFQSQLNTGILSTLPLYIVSQQFQLIALAIQYWCYQTVKSN